MATELIDTHAHLDDERFAGDLPEALQRARDAGVIRVVAVATTAVSSAACVELASRHDVLAATVGIQPNHVAEAAPPDWDAVVALSRQPQVVALGETGLDRYWDRAPFALQEDYFARHLALARELGCGVVIHCREAEADVVRMLRDDFDRHGPVRGVMHSFTGTLETAQACLAMAWPFRSPACSPTKTPKPARRRRQIPPDRVLVKPTVPTSRRSRPRQAQRARVRDAHRRLPSAAAGLIARRAGRAHHAQRAVAVGCS